YSGEENRPARFDDSIVSKWAAPPELEHEPTHLRLLPAGEFHFHEHDSPAWGHHSYGYAQRRWPDRIGGPARSPDPGPFPAGERRQVNPRLGRLPGTPPDRIISTSRPWPPTLRTFYALDSNIDSDLEGNSGRSGDYLAQAVVAGRIDSQVDRRIVHLSAARSARTTKDRADRPGRNGSSRVSRIAHAGVA